MVSTPVVWRYSGWPGVFEPSWRKFSISVEADRRLAGRLAVPIDLLDAGKVQQRIEQHRGMADRQHEAVAIGPVGLVGIGAQELATRAYSRPARAPSACRDGPNWPSAPHPSTACGSCRSPAARASHPREGRSVGAGSVAVSDIGRVSLSQLWSTERRARRSGFGQLRFSPDRAAFQPRNRPRAI